MSASRCTYTVKNFFKLFPARESLVSDIPAGDEKNDNLFLQCVHVIGDFWIFFRNFQTWQQPSFQTLQNLKLFPFSWLEWTALERVPGRDILKRSPPSLLRASRSGKGNRNLTFMYTVVAFYIYTDKKNFLICKEIQSGAVAKSYMRKGFLIYEEMCK